MDRRSLLAGAAAAGLAGGARSQEPAPEPTYEGMTFQSHDKAIRAIHYRPVGEGRRAAIVMMHGSGGRITNRGPWHQLAMRFAGDGYQVLTPLYTDAYPDDGIRPERMMEAWRDVGEHAIDWFIERGVDRRRTAMFGYSLGSYVAVDGALGNSRAAAATGLAGGTDVYTPRTPRRRIPVLMIRAEGDTHVLPRNTAAWVDFLREHDINVRVEVLRDSDHIFTAPKWLEIFQLSSAFYGGNIGRIDQDTA
ncbi:dienelactone hydrolase family protein [Brevundimonas sp.]|uniref:dienelactone hydrolase family protein n=1 Tax=Brevundimonas sp. TaxID=1871086 RepID=UPI002D68AC57|nr:dienelactone hydrolase family protein [Brevundimonas sp.]HYC69077.1 dienelactone hydrolase family protein [Brevundimonas sp.]